jgi:WD40 repeat protein
VKFKWFVRALCLIILTSCTSTSKIEQVPPPVTQTTVLQSVTHEPLKSPQPTQSSTPTQISASKDCGSQNDIKQTSAIGKIVFNEPNKGIYFYDIQKGQNGPPIDGTTPWLNIEASPDKRRIVIFNQPGEAGKIITSEGMQSIINTGKIDGSFYGWLNNEKLIFVDHNHSDGSVIIFDIGTGRTEERVTNLTDVNFDPVFWYAGGGWPSVIFDSSLSRLIYTKFVQDQPPLGFILRDYDTKKVLWEKHTLDISVKPKWSPDGKYVAVVVTNDSNDQIYILDRNGKETQIIDTYLFGVNQIEWSPNSEKISFNVDKDLTIYDLTTKQRHGHKMAQDIFWIVWSPDSNQLAVKGAIIDDSTNCVFTFKPENPIGPMAWLVE